MVWNEDLWKGRDTDVLSPVRFSENEGYPIHFNFVAAISIPWNLLPIGDISFDREKDQCFRCGSTPNE